MSFVFGVLFGVVATVVFQMVRDTLLLWNIEERLAADWADWEDWEDGLL